jgi:hypothetical protein
MLRWLLAPLALCACSPTLEGAALRARLQHEQDPAQCRMAEQTLLAKLEPTVMVRAALPDALAPMPPSAAATLHRRAVFVRLQTGSNAVEGADARVELGIEVEGSPSPLVLPREHALATLAGLDVDANSAVEDDAIQFAPAREATGLMRSITDGIQTGYALFIVPFVMTTTLAGREMPTIERSADEDDARPRALRDRALTPLVRVLEQGGCSLVAGGGCSRWLVIPRPEDERRARVSLSFAITVAPGTSAIVTVPLAPGASIEERVRAAFSPNEERPLRSIPGARYTSICERRAR